MATDAIASVERTASTDGEGEAETHDADSGVVRASSPQWVLTKMTVEDGLPATPDQVQSIDYAGLRYNYKSREYLGARMAETVDDPDGEKVFTRRFFHQTRELRPRLEFEEIENAGGEVLRTEKTDWVGDNTVNESGNDVPDSYFPEPRTPEPQERTITIHPQQIGIYKRDAPDAACIDPFDGDAATTTTNTGPSVFTVASSVGFNIGDVVLIELAAGGYGETIIQNIPDGTTIVVSPGVAGVGIGADVLQMNCRIWGTAP